MAVFLAVANRKGGVGKSTTSVMLAHALSVWGNKRVLLMDLDSQCNASLILLGGQGWNEARKAYKTIADYLFDMFDESAQPARDYLEHAAGDVADDNGKPPVLSLLPGSLLLEDVQGELFVKEARQSRDPDVVANRVKNRLEKLLRRFEMDFDVIILDCPPGLSFAALSALKIADKVLVPFRPDFVSRLAVDRVAMIIENQIHINGLEEIPIEKRRYTCLANYVRKGNGRERLLIEEIELFHPLMETQMPHLDGIANAFDWEPTRKTIGDKYGDATEHLHRLYTEISPILST